MAVLVAGRLLAPAAIWSHVLISAGTRAALDGGRPGVRPISAAFLKYLTGPRATTAFRDRGMLLVGEAWPAVGGPATPPGP